MSDCQDRPWDPRLAPLLKRTAEIRDLNATLAVLGWDQQVYMPSGAAAGRAAQLETLTVIVHEKSTDPVYGALIREAAAMDFEPDSDEAALIRRLERDFRKKQAVPAELAGRIARQCGETQSAWEAAYAASDFRLCSESLKKLLALEREYADCFPEAGSRYDAMLDDYEEGTRRPRSIRSSRCSSRASKRCWRRSWRGPLPMIRFCIRTTTRTPSWRSAAV